MMSAYDLALLVEQFRLAAEANAIAHGNDSASVDEVASSIRTALQSAGVWRSAHAQHLYRYADGEMTLEAFAHYLAGRK